MKEITQADLGTVQTVRENSTRAEEVVKIPLNKIIVREGFNVRQNFGDIEGLALSIIENGQAVPGRVDVLADGTFLLVDGHRRFLALQQLADMGDEPFFKATVNPKKTSEEQRIIQLFTTQDNKPLEPVEVAELIKRLANIGYNQSEIAKKIGKSHTYVQNMLAFANESKVVKDAVKDGAISLSTVTKLQKDIPVASERTEAVKKAVEKKVDSKQVKASEVTGKDKKADIADEIIAALELDAMYRDAIINIIKKHL
jgi:ParB family chromosome partitioning protein